MLTFIINIFITVALFLIARELHFFSKILKDFLDSQKK